MDQEQETNNYKVWDMNHNGYECDCPGPPPPEFLLPPPPAPPSAAFCQDNSVVADMEYCDFKVLEGSYTQTAIPSIAVIVICSLFMLVMLLVATILLWKHKKKMQNFLPCKTSPQNHCDLAGGNSVLYEDLTNIRPRNLTNHCVPDQTITPIEVGAPSQLKLLDVKCSNYGGAGFTPMSNTMFIYPPCESDTIKSNRSREHFNPAYEEVSAGSDEKPTGESQDSDLESEEAPSVASEDAFAEDELSLVEFPKKGPYREGSGAESGTSSLRGSTGDDLCKDLDSMGSGEEGGGGGTLPMSQHHHHHHHHHLHHHPHHPSQSRSSKEPPPKETNVAAQPQKPPSEGTDPRMRTMERNRQHHYGGGNKNAYYEKDVLGSGNELRPYAHEAELIEQLRQGANSGVALGPHAYPVGSYSSGHGRPLYPVISGGGSYYPSSTSDIYGRASPHGVTYTPGVYGAGELGPKDSAHSAPPPVYTGVATGTRRSRNPESRHPPTREADGGGGGGGSLGSRLLHPGLLPVPLLSELNQKLSGTPPSAPLPPTIQNGNGSSGSNRNSRSSSGSGGSAMNARNSDPHERTLTEFSTFRPRKGSGRADIYAVDSGFGSTATPVSTRRNHEGGPRHPPTPTPEAQKLLDESGGVERESFSSNRPRRNKNSEKLITEMEPTPAPRTVIT